MGFVDNDVVIAFVKSNSWVTSEPGDEGLAEIYKQIDDIIYQYTKVAVPVSAASANPTLQNIACALFVYYTTGKQGEISAEEKSRREKLYDDAMNQLEAIRTGNLILYDSEGTAITTVSVPVATFTSTQRITDIL